MGSPFKTAILTVTLTASTIAIAADNPKPNKLPDPLTLEYALSLADEAHPDLLLKDAEILGADARKQDIEANGDLSVDVDITALAVDEETSYIANQDHVRAGITASKTFYDFGYTDSLIDGADEVRNSRILEYHDARAKRRMDILTAYFDVLLADLKFNLYNEAMAVGYVNFDKAKDRREVGQRTDLDVLRLEAEYQQLRISRYQSENQQRETRAALAEVLNRPGQLPSTLAMPDLKVAARKLPEVEDLQKAALEKNLHIQALRHNLRAAQLDLQAARKSDGPTLKGKLGAYAYEGDYGSEDDVRAELSLVYNLRKPEKDADVAASLSRLYTAQAELQKAESSIRQQVLSIWHQIEELSVKRDEVKVLLQLRELELEKSRALYEMEVKADLGYSMTDLTKAQLESAQTDYKLALAWYKLDLLTANIKLDLNQRINQPEATLREEK
ncbi:MAG: TolC family protein [Thioalkalispiraceae bacterium]|jgi:outer membrane protein TolC